LPRGTAASLTSLVHSILCLIGSVYSTCEYTVDPTQESGQNLYRQYAGKKGKIVLDARWIHECVRAGALQTFQHNWAECKVTGTEMSVFMPGYVLISPYDPLPLQCRPSAHSANERACTSPHPSRADHLAIYQQRSDPSSNPSNPTTSRPRALCTPTTGPTQTPHCAATPANPTPRSCRHAAIATTTAPRSTWAGSTTNHTHRRPTAAAPSSALAYTGARAYARALAPPTPTARAHTLVLPPAVCSTRPERARARAMARRAAPDAPPPGPAHAPPARAVGVSPPPRPGASARTCTCACAASSSAANGERRAGPTSACAPAVRLPVRRRAAAAGQRSRGEHRRTAPMGGRPERLLRRIRESTPPL
jgi:hypothetical protein